MIRSSLGRFLMCLSPLLILSGCSESGVEVATSVAASEIVNVKCPIMGHEVETENLDPALVKEWNGKKVGFCCPPCLEEWDELTDAEKAEKIANPSAGHSKMSDEPASTPEAVEETPVPTTEAKS